MLDREEYIEQAYFFRALRERIEESMPMQQSRTDPRRDPVDHRLPMAFANSSRPSEAHGLLIFRIRAVAALLTSFQSFVCGRTETRNFASASRWPAHPWSVRRSTYPASPTQPGFSSTVRDISRNRLGMTSD